MTKDFIPDDIKQFILDHIDSVAQLEGLLLLRGSPETQWDVGAISQRLFITEQQTVNLLDHLGNLGLVKTPTDDSPVYHYQPDSADLNVMVERIAEAYKKFLIPVTNLIHSKPQTRVQEFADAFKLRRRKK